MQKLQAEGFVITEPYVGSRVSEVHAETVVELFELLKTAELISSRAACRLMDEEDFDELAQHINKMDALVTDPSRWAEGNVKLHLFICEKAGTRLAYDLFERVSNHWLRLQRLYLRDVFSERIPDAQADHHKLLAALRQRDEAKVSELISQHNEQALQSYLHHLAAEVPEVQKLIEAQ